MKIQFKKYAYQLEAVKAVVDCFKGQPKQEGIQYRVDPGIVPKGESFTFQQQSADDGFRNAPIMLTKEELLKNIQNVQRMQGLEVSSNLVSNKFSPVNLDIEMETGTGKTYVYIRTIFELNRLYGWSKFIVMVPSIAIREGVYKSFQMTKDHFLEEYHKQAHFFIYDSKRPEQIEVFSTNAGIEVMIINIQAFNSNSGDNRRIYQVLEDFQSRRPIDVISANNPILILDEPQKISGKKTLESLSEFKAPFILRYSATHTTQHNLIHRLDALDAYHKKLVKRIGVRGITVNSYGGTHGYLFLEGIDLSAKKPPIARIFMEVKSASGTIRRVTRKIEKGDNLYELSGEMAQYKEGYLVTDIIAVGETQKVFFENGIELLVGEVVGDVSEDDLRRIQIRETIRAHFEKEKRLFKKDIKTLSLFFIDEVVKYRDYEQEDTKGLYARMFEEEYKGIRDQYLSELSLTEEEEAYHRYLKNATVESVHKGYFSIDKKSNRLIDPKAKGSSKESDNASDYDLIMKDKERLLSFEEPTRFIFSHSALREGWDNPNVFTLCNLRNQEDHKTVRLRQEIGRGLRIAVNQRGERQDDPATVHDINILDVIANESYESFAANLQSEILKELENRPRKASTDFFKGRMLIDEFGRELKVTEDLAQDIMFYLTANRYLEADRTVSETYQEARKTGELAPIEGALSGKEEEIAKLVDQLLNANSGKGMLSNSFNIKTNKPQKHNLERKEFLDLWSKINKKAIYHITIDTNALIKNSVAAINERLNVRKLEYVIQKGMQNREITDAHLAREDLFQSGQVRRESYRHVISSSVKYDLLGDLSQNTDLMRATIAIILSKIIPTVFAQYAENPEDFITQVSKIINEQKVRIIINQVTYNPTKDSYETTLFTETQIYPEKGNIHGPLIKHVMEYAVTDSKVEDSFLSELEENEEVVVYAKLPNDFKIPTPVGDYIPDWAITFKEGNVKHIYFIAETKGTTSTMELRYVERAKIECARRFFNSINPGDDSISYGVVSNYNDLLQIIRS